MIDRPPQAGLRKPRLMTCSPWPPNGSSRAGQPLVSRPERSRTTKRSCDCMFSPRSARCACKTSPSRNRSVRRSGTSRGAAPNSIRDYVTLVGAVFTYEIRRGRCESNPVSRADLPRRGDRQEVRYLTRDELESLLAAVPTDELGQFERVLYLTAAMTGLRRGELLALRRLDVDLEAGLFRVRRSFRRGRFDSPKTRSRSARYRSGQRVRTALAKHVESPGSSNLMTSCSAIPRREIPTTLRT